MTAEADVLAELRRLRVRVPQLTGAFAARTDGVVLAADIGSTPEEAKERAERLAALTASVLGAAAQLSGVGGQGGFRELLVRGEQGYTGVYGAGPSAVLALLAGPRVNVGRLHLEARRAGARVGDLIDDALGALERPEAN
ncbi:roadblock/LC7 domain-containing protein [Streptomyces albipurpureus]|uniref:Roadblock/LC7 domain-containing protein n=1 Tax=Streptomyces albipurpureus TaxID=2897419 RepID=A0ABT0UQ73_9ACTN|nr:roadblock/LC7 domain-containing protein [Streptomyces sp. CWNU-1]MCM2390144.1 roadblock/LC7 domain-containing protein [Streptomyces sp. CWNU-1]